MNRIEWPCRGAIVVGADEAGKPYTVHDFATHRLAGLKRSGDAPEVADELEALTSAPDRPLTADDLVFSAASRCRCGAGFCHPSFVKDPDAGWRCSAVILGTAKAGSEHDPLMLRIFFPDIQAEDSGVTTRP